MKTRVSKISNLIFIMSFSFLLQSCNKEDFYKKEYLDNPYQSEPTDGPVDEGDQGGENTGSGGDTQGGDDSGVASGTTGGTTDSSTTGGYDGSTTGGGSTGGDDGSSSTGSSTTGGDDGSSSTSSSTTGGDDGSSSTSSSTTGGDDGSSSTSSSTTGGDDGSTTGGTTGSTTGGSDGSTTGGTIGSSTGGSTGGSYGDCNQGHGNDADGVDESNPTIGLEPKCKNEVFEQVSSDPKKLDVLWIIDNSGSMEDEQSALGTNFSAFIDDFITKDVDFKMAITTTDASSAERKGRIVTGSDVKLTSQKANTDEAQFKADFNSLVRVGTSGSPYEKGLAASEGFMAKYASTFLRADAYLAVVVLSDEEDQSSNSVTHYVDYLKSFKAQAGLVKVYTIGDINKDNSGPGVIAGADRYIEASEATAGVVSNINNDFHQSLSSMGDSLINLLDSFPLQHEPESGTLKVYVNSIENFNYTYDAASRSIKFAGSHIPSIGSVISVYYVKK